MNAAYVEDVNQTAKNLMIPIRLYISLPVGNASEIKISWLSVG